MKSPTLAGIVSIALIAASTVLAATDQSKEVTLTGSGKCAKCALGVADECQNALVVKKDGKDQVYLLTKNEVSDSFHKNICKGEKEIKVTGAVKDSGDKKEITASKIELVKG